MLICRHIKNAITTDEQAVLYAQKIGFNFDEIKQAVEGARVFFKKNMITKSHAYGERFRACYALKDYRTIKGFIEYAKKTNM